MSRILLYDLETYHAIPPEDEDRHPGITYANGWTDYANMGVSTICAYDYQEQRFHVYLRDTFNEFARLARRAPLIIGWNSRNFDDKVLRHSLNFSVSTDYDLKDELYRAMGLEPNPKTRSDAYAGCSLIQTAVSNGFGTSAYSGAMVPIYAQRGEWGKVIDHCLQDVHLIKTLFDTICQEGGDRQPERWDNVAD